MNEVYHTDKKVSTSRKRPETGERRIQILQTLASMLEQPHGERITTAALAKKLELSEAALYRHFASKAQMFDTLIDFIENSIFRLIHQISELPQDPKVQVVQIVKVFIVFAKKNPGMAKVMTGDALLGEHQRLQTRVTLFFDKVEANLRQLLRQQEDSPTPETHARLYAQILLAYLLGRLQRYVKSGFKVNISQDIDQSLALILS
jgi:TetR/AcrR family transcriptional regulator